MNSLAPTDIKEKQQEFPFSQADFETIARFAKQHFGLDLQPSKKPLVYSRLAKRLRALGITNFSDYCAFLHTDPEGHEVAHLLSALTTNVTHFFRENHHFEFLMEHILPSLITRAKNGEAIRIWSAACSAGQEAYSIAASILAVEPKACAYDIRILATDIDAKMIQIARSGTYPEDQRTAIPEFFQSVMLQEGVPNHQIQIRAELRSLITFNELNLIGQWPMRRKFDVIICRNAAIYFDKATQATLWERFATTLKERGHLIIGHSERLNNAAEQKFESVGITTYRRK